MSQLASRGGHRQVRESGIGIEVATGCGRKLLPDDASNAGCRWDLSCGRAPKSIVIGARYDTPRRRERRLEDHAGFQPRRLIPVAGEVRIRDVRDRP
jgi:hypothetical protein